MDYKLLISYAFIKTIYEKTGDYIDTFCPFVVSAVSEFNDFIDKKDIQKKVDEKFGIFIPIHSLEYIITRAKRKGLLVAEKKKINITKKGLDYYGKIEPLSSVNRRISEVIKDIKNNICNSLTEEEIYNILMSFVNKNIESIVDFCLLENESPLNLITKEISEYEKKLIEYFKNAENSKPAIWETLKDIVLGSVIAFSTITIDISNVDRKFKPLVIYLDSNYVFSLLELHDPDSNKSALELFEMLIKYNFSLRIFDFTLSEIIYYLKNYLNNQNNYYEFANVNSIYSVLKRKGFTSLDILKYIQDLSETLKQLGIEIELTSILLENYNPKNDAIIVLSKYKVYSEHTFKHDLAVIEEINKKRGFKKYRIEDSFAIFLTSDLRLAKANFELSHKHDCSVCDVISDRLFTNILWLKNPKINKSIPISYVISANSKTILINRQIWERFQENLVKLKSSNEISGNDISMLFYNNYIQEELLRFDEKDVTKITKEFILTKAGESQKIIDSGIQDKLEKQDMQFETSILEKNKQIEALIEKNEVFKEKVKESSIVTAKRITNSILVAIIISLGVGIYFISIFSNKFINLSNIVSVYFIIDIFLDIKKTSTRRKINDKIFHKICNKRLEFYKLK